MTGLRLEGVGVTRGGRAVLQDVTLALTPGRLTAVIGPNGAGKSTLLAVAAGLLPVDAGRVSLDGIAVGAIGRRVLARRRAYLPQERRIEWPISVERVVALGLTPVLPAFGGLPASQLEAIDRALAACDLLPLRDRPATALSGGELARTMLARAIVGDPEVLIVDEPTAGLDPRHAIDAARRLRAHAEDGRTVLMAIHDLDLAARYADDIIAVRDGRVLAHGPVVEVLTESLLLALFDIRATVICDAGGVAIRFID